VYGSYEELAQDRKTPLIYIIANLLTKIIRFDRKAGSTREVSNIFEYTQLMIAIIWKGKGKNIPLLNKNGDSAFTA
jgi:hypothetical protein